MARRAAGGRELSFHKASKRWYKSYRVGDQKQTKYFCSGKSARDERSYQRALKEFRVWWPQVVAEKHARKIGQRVGNFLAGKLQANRLGDSPLEQQLRLTAGKLQLTDLGDDRVSRYVRDRYPDWSLTDQQRQERKEKQMFAAWMASRDQRGQQQRKPVGKTIADHIERWLKYQQTRRLGEEIGQSGYDAMLRGIGTLREHVNGAGFGAPQEVEAMLMAYRGYLSQQLGDGQYTAHTANDKLKFAAQFIRWAYEQRVLAELPRSLEKFVHRFPVVKEGHPLPLIDIRKLWKMASPRLRCFIALGLNCGFKNKDITSLDAGQLDSGRLIGWRSKTKVPMNYKLWPVTWELIQQCRNDAGGDTGVWSSPIGEAWRSAARGFRWCSRG